MRTTTVLLMTAALCACGGSSPRPDPVATPEPSAPEMRCYEGEYRLYDAAGGIRETSLVAVRYTIHDEKIVMEDVERGGERSSETFTIDGDAVRTESEGYQASGGITREDGTISLRLEGTAGQNATSTSTRIGPNDASEIWRISADTPGKEVAGYILQYLVRVEDETCDARFDAVADGQRPTLARRGTELIEAADGDSSNDEMVTFSFAWPTDLSAIVWGDMSRERNGAQATSRTPYRLETVAASPNTTIVFDAQYAELFAPSGNEAIRNAVQATDYLAYPFLVDPTGAIAGIADYATTAAIARTGVQAQVGAEASARVDSAFTERGMLQSVSKFWDPMIGAWRGATMKIGEVRQAAVEVPIMTPFGGTAVVRAQNSFALLGRVPCRPEDETTNCVLVQMSQVTDPSHAAAVLAELYKKLEGDTKPPAIEDYAMEFTALTVLDPRTLLPYEYLELTKVSMALAGESGAEPRPVERVEAKTLTFHYR